MCLYNEIWKNKIMCERYLSSCEGHVQFECQLGTIATRFSRSRHPTRDNLRIGKGLLRCTKYTGELVEQARCHEGRLGAVFLVHSQWVYCK